MDSSNGNKLRLRAVGELALYGGQIMCSVLCTDYEHNGVKVEHESFSILNLSQMIYVFITMIICNLWVWDLMILNFNNIISQYLYAGDNPLKEQVS